MDVPTASWIRRIVALFVDWAACTLAIQAFIGPGNYYASVENGDVTGNVIGTVATTALFVIESALFTATMGGSFGQLATRLRVIPADGRAGLVSPLRALGRQILIALVIPPLVFRSDGRGLHDLAAGTATVTVQTWRALTGRS
jgi:uncharacterized RDD family membrane protein YckC